MSAIQLLRGISRQENDDTDLLTRHPAHPLRRQDNPREASLILGAEARLGRYAWANFGSWRSFVPARPQGIRNGSRVRKPRCPAMAMHGRRQLRMVLGHHRLTLPLLPPATSKISERASVYRQAQVTHRLRHPSIWFNTRPTREAVVMRAHLLRLNIFDSCGESD